MIYGKHALGFIAQSLQLVKEKKMAIDTHHVIEDRAASSVHDC